METLLFCIAFLVIGIVFGWRARGVHVKARAEMLLKQLQNNSEETTQEDFMIHITIEKHNNTFYVYKKGSSEFMAQGSTKEELEDVLRDRFPGKRFACEEKILSEVGFI